MPRVGALKRRPDFLRVAAGRVKWVTPGLVLQARCRGEAEEEVRVGFTVSRKVGNAVRRNRARRRLRAAAGDVLPKLGRPGCDYVVIGRAATLERPFQDLVGDLRDAVEALARRGCGRRKRKARASAEPRA